MGACFNPNMKVLHLPIILCNQPSEMVRALNKAGVKADYMVLDTQNAEWLLTHNNIKWHINASALNKNDPTMRKLRQEIYKFLVSQINNYDIFHFHSNISLFSSWFGNYKDLEILKKAGKKIVVSYWGCDIRQKSVNKNYPYNSCEICAVPCQERERNYRKEFFAKYADLTVVHSLELMEYAPNGSILIPLLIDTNYWKGNVKNNVNQKAGNLKILHSFGNSQTRGDVKGTERIINAINDLKKEGYEIDFLFCDKVPSSQLREIYDKTDLLVEQLNYGVYGLTALEAMSMEKPVIGYVRPEIRKYFKNEVPIIDANPNNIKEVLEKIIDNRDDLSKIGERSRQFVIKHHDSKKVAALLIESYKKLLKEKVKPDKTSIDIASEIRRAIGFKVLLMTPDDLEGENIIKQKAKKLVNNGYKATVIGYALPNADTSVPEYKKIDGYESFRFCYEVTPPYFRFYDLLGLLRVHPPETKFFSKMTIFGKIFNAVNQFINNILYYSFYSFRHYFLLTYQFYNKGSQMWPDIVYARDVSTLIVGSYIKKVTKCYLIYDSSENNIQTKVKFSKLTKVIFSILEKFYLSKADIYIANGGIFAKKADDKLFSKFKVKEKKLNDIFDILIRSDV